MDLVLRAPDQRLDLVRPDTGEVIDAATATREDIAGFYLAVQEWKRRADEAERLASRLFADLSDKETTLSVVVDGKRVSVPGPGDTFVLNSETLRAELLGLVSDGKLSQAAADDACKPRGVECPECGGFVATGGYDVSKRALNALRKQPWLNTVIDSCGEYVAPSSRPLKATAA